jgi:AbiU2
MSGSFDAEEVEQQYVASMGKDLGQVYNRLQSECTLLNSTWQQFVELFATNEKRVEVLHWSAPYFFKVVHDVFLESTLLRICRISDPAASLGKENLSLARLPSLVDNVIRPDVEASLVRIHSAAEFARDWRNRHIAHLDFALTFDEGAVQLAPFTRKKVDEVIQEIGTLLNLIEEHYRQATVAFHRLIAPGQADDLLQLLNEEFEREREFQERLKTGRLTNEDLTKQYRPHI